MKAICMNCKSSKPVDKAIIEASVDMQSKIVKTKKDFVRQERRAKVAAIKESVEYTDLMKVNGMISVVQKPTDPKEGSLYFVCSNAEHLKDEKVEREIVHKYYFECPHFVAR